MAIQDVMWVTPYGGRTKLAFSRTDSEHSNRSGLILDQRHLFASPERQLE
jgi:hypothetical protein